MNREEQIAELARESRKRIEQAIARRIPHEDLEALIEGIVASALREMSEAAQVRDSAPPTHPVAEEEEK